MPAKLKDRKTKIFLMCLFIMSFIPVFGSATELDFDSDCSSDLADAVIALQTVSGAIVPSDGNTDIDGDGKTGVEEVIHILRGLSGLLSTPYTFNDASLITLNDLYEDDFYSSCDEDWIKFDAEQ